jgi:HlyD family secretion protein
MRRRVLIALLVAAAVAGAVVWRRGQGGERWYTGFVEGEERVLRSEVSGRVLEVPFEEGDRVPANAVVARIDPSDIAARVASKRQQIEVLGAQQRRQEEQVALAESTWTHDVAAGRAAVARSRAEAELAAKDYERARNLRAQDVASMQALDTQRTRHDAATSALARERELLRRAEAAEGEITVARRQLDVLREQRTLAERQLGELEVQLAKHEIRAPSVDTVVQTKLLWPGELAQPGTAVLAVLDPLDKYVQIYVPVEDLDRVRVGQRVEIELDSAPGRRVPGEIGFVADEANFTPEKIETRADRMAQVYRAKVRILEDVERFQPGAEGNVYLVGEDEETRAAGPTEGPAPGAR